MKQYPLLSAHSLPLCLVALLLVLAFSLMAGPIASPSLQADSGCNPIVIENQLPGTEDWQLTKPANDINHQIKGYASSTSVNNGDTLDFYVSVKPAQKLPGFVKVWPRVVIRLGSFTVSFLSGPGLQA